MRFKRQLSTALISPFSGLILFLSAIICILMIINSIDLANKYALQDQEESVKPFLRSLTISIAAFNRTVVAMEDGHKLSSEKMTFSLIKEELLSTSAQSSGNGILLSPHPATTLFAAPDDNLFSSETVNIILESQVTMPGSEETKFYRWHLILDNFTTSEYSQIFLLNDEQIVPLLFPRKAVAESVRLIAEGDSEHSYVNIAGLRYGYHADKITDYSTLIFLHHSNLWTSFPWLSSSLILFLLVVIANLSFRLRRVRNTVLDNEGFLENLFSSNSDWLQPLSGEEEPEVVNEHDLIERYNNHLRKNLRQAMDSLGAGILFFREKKLVYLNRVAHQLFNLSEEDSSTIDTELLMSRLVDSKSGKPVDLDQLLQSSPTSNCSVMVQHTKDSSLQTQLACTARHFPGEDIHIVTILDQTKVKRIEERLNTQNDFLSSILESISDPFYVIHAETRAVVMSNKAAKNLISTTPASTCQALNPASKVCENKNQLCPFELSRLTKVSSIVERMQITPEGNRKYFEIHGHPIKDSNDNVTHVIEYQLDVTDRKRADKTLRESEERYSSLFEKNNSVMILYDPENGRIVDANPAACEYYGYSRDEFSQKHIVDINTMSPFELYREMQKAKREGRHQLYFEHRLASGEIRDVEAYTGVIVVGGKNLYYLIVYDITERRQAERDLKNLIDIEALAASISTRFIRLQAVEIDEQIVEALAEIGTFAGFERCLLLITKPDFSGISKCFEWHDTIVDPVAEKARTLGIENLSWFEEQTETAPSIFVHDVRSGINKGMRELLFWQKLDVEICHYITFHLTQGEKGLLMFENSNTPHNWNTNYDSFIRIVSELFNNALDKKYYEQRMLENQEVLKSLSTHIQDEIESVRSSIAREIHDELGQLMTALKFDVRFIRKKHEQKDGEALEGTLDSMTQVIDQAIESIQSITAQLRPILLDDLGLSPAIEWHCQDFSKRTGITINLDLDDVELPPQESTTLFRVCQESLTNVARHSMADTATVKLVYEGDHVRLQISDKGVGISKEQLNSNKSFGIIGLRERVSSIGGAVTISSNNGKGTIIDVWIPLEKDLED